jgi:hypothetical protein
MSPGRRIPVAEAGSTEEPHAGDPGDRRPPAYTARRPVRPNIERRTLDGDHRATVLLGAIAFHAEEDTLRQWLTDEEWVRPKQARAVMERKQELAKERMREAGVDTSGRSLSEIGGEIYDLLSRPAHHRRGGSPETLEPDLREFTYGPHPSAEVRARYLDYAGELVETALLVVIDTLGDMIGRDYVKDNLPPMQARLEELRIRFPLP